MSPLRQALVFGMVLTVGGMAPPAWAGDRVSTWVDSEGVRHFSQFPPAQEDVQQLETLQLDTPPAAVPLDERLEAIRAVSRELELARQQREEQRKRHTAESAETEQPNRQPEPEQDSRVRILPYPYSAPYPPRYPYSSPPHRHERRPPPEIEQPAPHNIVPQMPRR